MESNDDDADGDGDGDHLKTRGKRSKSILDPNYTHFDRKL